MPSFTTYIATYIHLLLMFPIATGRAIDDIIWQASRSASSPNPLSSIFQPQHSSNLQNEVYLEDYTSSSTSHKDQESWPSQDVEQPPLMMQPWSSGSDCQVIVELDIIVSCEEWQGRVASAERRTRSLRKKRAVGMRWGLWDQTIYYHFSPNGNYNHYEKQLVQNGMNDWQKYTCLKFEEADVNDNSGEKGNRVVFIDGNGCFADIGMKRGEQVVSLQKVGCRYKSVVLHELGHTVGLWHEHTRPDRDEHITINQANVIEWDKYYYNFQKLHWSANVQTFDIPYDYQSIMHYGQYTLSVKPSRDLKTIVTKDPKFQNIIGNAQSLSFSDVKTVNLMYSCKPKECEKSDRSCPGEGFVGKDCSCWCPSDQYGTPMELCNGGDRPDTPTLMVSPAESSVNEGESVTLTCHTDVRGAVIYKFLVGSSLINLGGNNRFTLYNVTKDNSGMYTCKLTLRGVDSLPSNSHALTVVKEAERPILTFVPPSETVPSNSRVILTCSTNRTGFTEYKIFKDGIDWYHGVVGTFTLPSAQTSHSGTFTCVVRINGVDSPHSNAHVMTVEEGQGLLVDGNWGAWSAWSSCSVTCGSGVKSRSRDCDSPPASNGGRACPGSGQETSSCVTSPCLLPVDGNWGAWSAWSSCSVTCGSGVISRSRSCDNPAATDGGRECDGNKEESVSCDAAQCLNCRDQLPMCGQLQKNGLCEMSPQRMEILCRKTCGKCSSDNEEDPWGPWSDWTPCSVTCGSGTQAKFRVCNKPPSSGLCFGGNLDSRVCTLSACPPECVDTHPYCEQWAERNFCYTSSVIIAVHCKKSCLRCSTRGRYRVGCKDAPAGSYALTHLDPTCRIYLSCHGGYAKQHSCSVGSSFDTETNTCSNAPNVTCPLSPRTQ